MIIEKLKEIIVGVKKTPAYESYFSQKEGMVPFLETRSKVQMPRDLLDDLLKYPSIDAQKELTEMVAEQFCIEALSRGIRYLHNVNGILINELEDMFDVIAAFDSPVLMVPPEVLVKIEDKGFKPTKSKAVTFMGVERVGVFEGKEVIMDPYMLANSFVLLPTEFLDFDLEIFSEEYEPYTFNMHIRGDLNNAAGYRITNFDPTFKGLSKQ